MKILYSKLLLGLFVTVLLFTIINPLRAQKVAKGINYQAVLRDSENKFITDKTIKVTISIYKKEINGDLVYEETHNPTTNKVGIFTLVIGQGTPKGSTSKFSDIRWGTEEHLLKVVAEVDGKTINFQATPMLSVPYAFFADSARVARADFSGVTFDPVSNTLKNSSSVIADLTPLRQTLEYDPATYHLSISGKPGIVDLRQFAHAPQDLRFLNNKLWVTGNKDSTVVDLSPYKQTLSVNATSKLQISGGNEVQMDTSNVNEIQKISRSESKIILSRNGGEVSVDTSNINEIQTISLTGNKIALSKSGSEVTIDASETNELQTLSKINGALVLSNAPNGRAIPIDTSLNNEIQTIQRVTNSDKIYLTGTTTEISVNDADADSGNELISSISFNQSTRELTVSEGTNNIKTVNLTPKRVAFRAIKTTNLNVSSGSYTLVFADQKIDLGDSYDAITGIFTVPVNGSGVYAFYFTAEFLDANLIYELLRNDQNPELLLPYNQPVILDLNENDTIKVRATASDATTIKKASFIGYRIN